MLLCYGDALINVIGLPTNNNLVYNYNTRPSQKTSNCMCVCVCVCVVCNQNFTIKHEVEDEHFQIFEHKKNLNSFYGVEIIKILQFMERLKTKAEL